MSARKTGQKKPAPAGLRGRPPKGYVHDPRSIPGMRDAARARAAGSMEKCIELWERMVMAGLTALRALEVGVEPNPAPKKAALSGSLAGKTVTVSRAGGEGSYEETREESHAYAGLDWDDVNRAAENLTDRAGFARKHEVDIETTEIPVKLFRLNTYRTKDGVRRELPQDTAGDPEQS